MLFTCQTQDFSCEKGQIFLGWSFLHLSWVFNVFFPLVRKMHAVMGIFIQCVHICKVVTTQTVKSFFRPARLFRPSLWSFRCHRDAATCRVQTTLSCSILSFLSLVVTRHFPHIRAPSPWTPAKWLFSFHVYHSMICYVHQFQQDQQRDPYGFYFFMWLRLCSSRHIIWKVWLSIWPLRDFKYPPLHCSLRCH